jgi:hypothetical protein
MKRCAEPVVIDRETIERRGAFTFEEWKTLFQIINRVAVMMINETDRYCRTPYGVPLSFVSKIRRALEELESKTPAGPHDSFVSQAALAKALGINLKSVNKLVAAGDIPLGVPVEHYVHRIATDPSSLEIVRRTPGAEFIGSGILEPSKTCQES